ncbi:MAG TPA: hypothetical protein VFJ58_04225 [Armatimonadota bacterium]|nr:hypothetical protein [Armatimonadota bacterium]
MPCIVLLETSGNQAFIFGTNKLRQNVGASELTYQAGTMWAMDAAAVIQPELALRPGESIGELLCDRARNPPLGSLLPDGRISRVEAILAGSGKAMFLVDSPDTGKQIVQYAALRAARDAPGLDLSGAVGDNFDWDSVPVAETKGEGDNSRFVGPVPVLYRTHQEAHAYLPSPLRRSRRIPIAAPCAFSGLPATGTVKDLDAREGDEREEDIAVSALAWSKQSVRKNAYKRLKQTLRDADARDNPSRFDNIEFPEELDKIPGNWLAIVHADGNGLGQIFLAFHKYVDRNGTPAEFNRRYVETLRCFSVAVDQCTVGAFAAALAAVWDPAPRGNNGVELSPVVPLILGGDDLTVVCSGERALRFTQTYLKEYEERSTSHRVILDIAKQAFGIGRLSACAGIAIIKPHFPFSTAYSLAEDLIKSAKKVKQEIRGLKTGPAGRDRPYPCSALDFYVVYDASAVELRAIRERLTVGDARLYGGPYIVTPIEQLEDATGAHWRRRRHWDDLVGRIDAITESDEDDRPALPSSQFHDLRAGLFLGRSAADARYALIRARYSPKLLKRLEGDNHSLFWKDEKSYTTGFLDAMEAAAFMTQRGETHG